MLYRVSISFFYFFIFLSLVYPPFPSLRDHLLLYHSKSVMIFRFFLAVSRNSLFYFLHVIFAVPYTLFIFWLYKNIFLSYIIYNPYIRTYIGLQCIQYIRKPKGTYTYTLRYIRIIFVFSILGVSQIFEFGRRRQKSIPAAYIGISYDLYFKL